MITADGKLFTFVIAGPVGPAIPIMVALRHLALTTRQQMPKSLKQLRKNLDIEDWPTRVTGTVLVTHDNAHAEITSIIMASNVVLYQYLTSIYFDPKWFSGFGIYYSEVALCFMPSFQYVDKYAGLTTPTPYDTIRQYASINATALVNRLNTSQASNDQFGFLYNWLLLKQNILRRRTFPIDIIDKILALPLNTPVGTWGFYSSVPDMAEIFNAVPLEHLLFLDNGINQWVAPGQLTIIANGSQAYSLDTGLLVNNASEQVLSTQVYDGTSSLTFTQSYYGTSFSVTYTLGMALIKSDPQWLQVLDPPGSTAVAVNWTTAAPGVNFYGFTIQVRLVAELRGPNLVTWFEMDDGDTLLTTACTIVVNTQAVNSKRINPVVTALHDGYLDPPNTVPYNTLYNNTINNSLSVLGHEVVLNATINEELTSGSSITMSCSDSLTVSVDGNPAVQTTFSSSTPVVPYTPTPVAAQVNVQLSYQYQKATFIFGATYNELPSTFGFGATYSGGYIGAVGVTAGPLSQSSYFNVYPDGVSSELFLGSGGDNPYFAAQIAWTNYQSCVFGTQQVLIAPLPGSFRNATTSSTAVPVPISFSVGSLAYTVTAPLWSTNQNPVARAICCPATGALAYVVPLQDPNPIDGTGYLTLYTSSQSGELATPDQVYTTNPAMAKRMAAIAKGMDSLTTQPVGGWSALIL